MQRGGIQIERGFSASLATRGGRPEAPEELERDAHAAEPPGDLARALRLRFRAVLLRLARARRSRARALDRPAVVRLSARAFDELARDHDEVVYGGRPASRADVEPRRRLAARARTRWAAGDRGGSGSASPRIVAASTSAFRADERPPAPGRAPPRRTRRARTASPRLFRAAHAGRATRSERRR